MLGDADPRAECPDGPGRVTPPSHARHRGHAGVVPSDDIAFFHQIDELALAEDRVAHIEAGKFDLPGTLALDELFQHPIVEGPVIFEFEGTDRMGNPFDIVGKTMGEIVHGVDDPVRAGAVVARPLDAVDDRVPHDDVRRGHIDFCTEHAASIGELARPHARKEVQVLLDRPRPVRTLLAGIGKGPAIRAYLIGVEVAHVGHALGDELYRVSVEPLVVVGGVKKPVVPVEAEPTHVGDDRLHEFEGFAARVGVVHPQVAGAPVLGFDAEIETDGLRMADVEIAVRLRREPRGDTVMFLCRQVVVNDFPDKIGWSGSVTRHCFTSWQDNRSIKKARQHYTTVYRPSLVFVEGPSPDFSPGRCRTRCTCSLCRRPHSCPARHRGSP